MGAYFTDRQGNTRFIPDDAEYKKLNDAEWGSSGDSQAKPSSEEKGSSTTTDTKETKGEESSLDKTIRENEEFLDQPWAQKMMAEGSLGKVPDKWGDVGTQIMQKIRPTEERAKLIEKNKEDDPLVEDEVLPGLYRTGQSALNNLVSLPLQAEAEGYLDPSYIVRKLGLGGFKDALSGGQPEFEKRLHEQYELNQKEIKQYGRVDGQPLGWRQHWVGGSFLSKDSDFFKKNRPQSEITDLGAQIVGVVGLTGAIRKGLSLLGSGRASSTFNAMKGIPVKGKPLKIPFAPNWASAQADKVLTNAAFFLRASAPEFGEELLLWPPEIPELSTGYEEQLEIWKKADPKTKLDLKRAFLSENLTEYNYHKAQVQQALLGGSIVGGAKWSWNILSNVMDVGWTAFKNIKLGTKASDAWQAAYKKFKPEIEKNIEGGANEAIQLELNLNVGKTTTALNDSVGKVVPEISSEARESAESFLVKTKDALDTQAELSKDINIDSVSIPEQRKTLVAELKELKKKLKVSSQSSIIAKTKLLDQRATAYRAAQKKDPNWLLSGKPSRGEAPNQRRLRILNNAIENMKRLEEVEIKLEELEVKELEFLANNSAYRNAQSQQLGAANDFQKFITQKKDEITTQADLLEARNKATEMDDNNRVRLGEVVEPDDTAPIAVEFIQEINDLLDEAQEAINNGQVTPEFLTDWVRRFEELNVKAVEEGVSAAPIKAVGSQPASDEGLLGPKTSPTEIPVPVDKDGLVDDVSINQGMSLADSIPYNVSKKADNLRRDLREALGTNKLAKGKEQLNQIGDDVDKLIDKLKEAVEYDKKHGTDTYAQNLALFRETNASIYTPDMSDQALLKVVHDRMKINEKVDGILAKALLELGQFVDDPHGAAQISFLVKEGMINRQNVKRLSTIPMQLAFLESNTINAMSALKRFNEVNTGGSTETTIESAAALALSEIDLLMRAVRAIEPLAQYLGTGLGLFRRKLRIKFPTREAVLEKLKELRPEERIGDAYAKARWELLTTEWNTTIADLPNPEELLDQMSHTAKTASQRFENTMGNTLKKLKNGEAISGEEFAEAMSVMDAVYKSGGNWDNLKLIDKTWSGVMNQMITSGTLSNPSGPLGIVQAGFATAIPSHISGYVVGHITSKLARFAGKEALEEGIGKRATLQSKWLQSYIYGFLNSWDGFSKKMLFPEAHPDYVKRSISLLNQQAKLDDLGATKVEIRTPMGKWALNKADFEREEIFNLINYGRVWSKSMHDNYISGADWEKLPPLIKGWRLPGSKEGSRRVLPGLGFPIQYAREAGFGKTPYYAKGEEQSMTGVLKSLSFADSFVTEVMANAHAAAVVKAQLAEEIAEGIIKKEDYKKELIKRLNKETSDMWEPITAGVDQKTVGYELRDKQFKHFKDYVNLTEEITGGPMADMKSAIDTLKNSDNPYLSAFATQLMPVTTSAFNWLKRMTSIISGFEAVRGGVDLTRLGGKVAKEKVAQNLPTEIVEEIRRMSPKGAAWLEQTKEFESLYLSEDITIRERAQQALGMSVAFHMGVWAMVNGIGSFEGFEITGPMTHTYKEASGLKKPFHIRIDVPFMDFPGVDAMEIPYLYLGPLGAVMALHTTARDLKQFGNTEATGDIIMLGIAAQARQMMEIPVFTGPDKYTDAIVKAADGNFAPLQRLLAETVSKVGNPTLGYNKWLTRILTGGAKQSSPLESKFSAKYYKKGSPANLGWGAVDTIIGTGGYLFEDNAVGPIVNAISSVIADDPTIWQASRRAMPFGKPGELITWSDQPRLGMAIEAVTGRSFPIKSRAEDDPVNQARLDNLIPPIDRNLFMSKNDGEIALSDGMVNELNHFLNEDALILSPVTGKTHVGIYSYILELVNSPEYKQLSGADVVNPYKTGNWDRKNSVRADYIKSMIRQAINVVKWQWVDGSEYPQQIPDSKAPGGLRPQRWFAEPELRKLINSRKKDI